jgi:hypothetical protein
MLAGQAVRIRDGVDHAHQSWFRPENRFPQRMFGTIETGVGAEHASVIPQSLLAIPFTTAVRLGGELRVSRQTEPWQADLVGLATSARGPVYASGEELDHADLELDEVDELYRLVGLRRYRRIWLAWDRCRLLGAAIAWRGPLGFNFSFLENRCDLLVDPALAPKVADAVVRSLIGAAASSYEDLPLGVIPLAVPAAPAGLAVAAGAYRVSDYTQSIWLRPGFEAMYLHMARVYARIERAGARLGIGAVRRTEGGAPCLTST